MAPSSSIERGEVELEALDGERHRFGAGNLIWLDGVRLRVLRNAGGQPVELKAISRPSVPSHRVSATLDRRRP